MIKSKFLLTIMILVFHIHLRASVDPLNGAFRYQPRYEQLKLQISYSSRWNQISDLGFGWMGSLPTSCSTTIENDLLRKIHCHYRGKMLIWKFSYDRHFNLKEVREPTGAILNVNYTPTDAVDNIAIGNCRYQFTYEQVQTYQQTVVNKMCQSQLISHRRFQFEIRKRETIAKYNKLN